MRYFEAQSQSWASPGTSRNWAETTEVTQCDLSSQWLGDTRDSRRSYTCMTMILWDAAEMSCSLLIQLTVVWGLWVQSLLLLSTAAWEWIVTQCHVSNCKMEMNTRLTLESDWRGLKALGAQNNSQYTTAWVLVTLTFPPFLADIYEI